jgi:hypothetical protein
LPNNGDAGLAEIELGAGVLFAAIVAQEEGKRKSVCEVASEYTLSASV